MCFHLSKVGIFKQASVTQFWLRVTSFTLSEARVFWLPDLASIYRKTPEIQRFLVGPQKRGCL